MAPLVDGNITKDAPLADGNNAKDAALNNCNNSKHALLKNGNTSETGTGTSNWVVPDPDLTVEPEKIEEWSVEDDE